MIQEDGSLTGPGLPYLGAGVYYWTVQAFTQDGGIVAESDSQFYVP